MTMTLHRDQMARIGAELESMARSGEPVTPAGRELMLEAAQTLQVLSQQFGYQLSIPVSNRLGSPVVSIDGPSHESVMQVADRVRIAVLVARHGPDGEQP